MVCCCSEYCCSPPASGCSSKALRFQLKSEKKDKNKFSDVQDFRSLTTLATNIHVPTQPVIAMTATMVYSRFGMVAVNA